MGGWFYWYEVRPAKIRHDCSWVKHTSGFVDAIPAMTEDELWQKGLLRDCSTAYESVFYESVTTLCESSNSRIIEKYKNAIDAVPAKEWWEPANPKEYAFCLHDQGL